MYKEKYYANSDFMSASLGSSPSFIWRSVLEARRFISAGSCWRIGTGTKIKIADQPWLNDRDNPYISTDTVSIADHNVASLFLPGTKEWNMDTIRDNFNRRDQ